MTNPTRQFEANKVKARAEKGAIAIWRAKVPVVEEASNPDYLAALLAKAGFGVTLITTQDLLDQTVLNVRNFDLLILPYGEFYPAGGADVIQSFLGNGGNLISLGGRCFRQLLRPSGNNWTPIPRVNQKQPSRDVVKISKKLVAALAPETKRGAAVISLGKDPVGNPSLAVVVPHLGWEKLIPFSVKGGNEYSVIHFRARGDARTTWLALEASETDGSAWKAVVPLSTQWQAYDLSLAEFVPYETLARGYRGDYLRAELIKKLAFGLAGMGQSFEISEIQWRESDLTPQAIVANSIVFTGPSRLLELYGGHPWGAKVGLQTTMERVDSTAFCDSAPFHGEQLRAAPGQFIFSQDTALPVKCSGWTATILEDNRHYTTTKRIARAVPLLVTADNRPAAALFVHRKGKYANSLWACFGVAGRALFAPSDRAMGRAFVSLAERMAHGAFFKTIEPRFDAGGGRARMKIVVEICNHSIVTRACRLHTQVLALNGKGVQAESVLKIELAPRETREIAALAVDADKFNWKAFKAQCRLSSAEGAPLDHIETSVDVLGTFLALCDRLMDEQKARGDGLFGGYSYAGNRGARGLMAAYDLTGRKAYLKAAIAWCQAVVDKQRKDGGYFMGPAYLPDNECFVADGGEMVCAIARVVSYVPERDKKRFMDSVRAYMRYRESFRCEGDGIGVGWCKNDYGAPGCPTLTKIIKIFAPEKNIYTIGCTLAGATMFTALTGKPQDNARAVKDAYWLMARCDGMNGGAFIESMIWAHKFLSGGNLKNDVETFLQMKFLPNIVGTNNDWWLIHGGKIVQGLDGLAYYYDCIEKKPEVLAELMRATWHICSPEAAGGIRQLLRQREGIGSYSGYFCFAAVSLPNLLQSEITRKGF